MTFQICWLYKIDVVALNMTFILCSCIFDTVKKTSVGIYVFLVLFYKMISYYVNRMIEWYIVSNQPFT